MVKASDPEQGVLSYSVRWGDENITSVYSAAQRNLSYVQSAEFTHAYAAAGVYNPTFTVTDDKGLPAKTSISVQVGEVVTQNHSPVITGGSSLPPAILTGQTVNFSWSAKDDDNDNLYWSVDWGDGIGTASACPVSNSSSAQGWTLNTSHIWNQVGTYIVKVTVSDCKGGIDSSSVAVNVIVVTQIAKDDFNNYTNGSILGQGNWVDYKNGQNFIIQNISAQEGTKSLYINAQADSVITKFGNLLSNGTQTVYVKTENRNNQYSGIGKPGA